MKVFLLFIILIMIFDLCLAQIMTDQEKQIIEKMLRKNNLQPDALNFLKDWASDTKFKLPVVVDILNDPMKYPDFVEATKVVLESSNPRELINYFCNIIIY